MFSRRKMLLACIAVIAAAFLSAQVIAQEKSIVVASTTSTQDSGLFEYLLPIFQQQTGIADAQAAADLAGYNASQNAWGAIFQGANLGSKLLGFGTRPSSGFSNFASSFGGGDNADTSRVTGLGSYS